MMMVMNRRRFLRVLPLALTAKPFDHPIGLNLYTVRGPLARDPANLLALAATGIKTLKVDR